ncbi:arylamine N-acetyltransferase [Kineosporia sp. NBRC 101731]|uniref:arylamine N-acetyltransferase family protein n=1 Tax=Kineosporia sp. NBRC 101731 TaxID=3032199 RepID=UPI0024A13C0D|nr:arylamine N-acetyltransferase [Kineosporia sp. NBRC 101731]GLY32344.1 N-hydroxyarylamine O-acetyltransferase [Kineosporia sp. NBRC 101731]
MDQRTIDAYLARIGARRPARPDLESLRHLQERHVLSVPFENLGYHLDEPIHLDEKVLTKIVTEHRGGGCYEVNPALGLLLQALGYQVDLLPGRVYRGGALGPPFCHLALRVHLEDEDWLVDAGFGRNSRRPLRIVEPAPQSDPHGEYLLSPTQDGGGLEVRRNGEPLYQLDLHPARPADFGPTLWWWRTSPQSPFLQDLFCTLATPQGRVTLKGSTLVRLEEGRRVVEELPDETAVLAAYKQHFGIHLDRAPVAPLVAADVTGPVGIQA